MRIAHDLQRRLLQPGQLSQNDVELGQLRTEVVADEQAHEGAPDVVA